MLLIVPTSYRRNLRLFYWWAAIVSWSATPAFTQALQVESLAAPSARFEFVAKKVVDEWEGISIGGGTNAPVKIAVIACNETCTSAEVLRIAEWGHVERARVGLDVLAQDGMQGLSGRRLQDDELASLDRLISQLPDQALDVPPVERRILVASPIDDVWKVKLYDRAAMPRQLNDIVKMVAGLQDRRHFGAWVYRLTPDREQTLREPPRRSRCAAHPHGTAFIVAEGAGALRVFDFALQELSSNTLSTPGNVVQCEFSSDGRFLAILSGAGSGRGGDKIEIVETASWKRVAAFNCSPEDGLFFSLVFAPDDDHLIALTRHRSRRIDTSTWKVSEERDANGESSRQFSSSGASAFVVKHDRSPWLLSSSGRSLVCLDETCKALTGAFSPDGKLLAALTVAEKEGVRLRVWQTKDASPCAELWPYGISWTMRGGNFEPVLCWSPDSDYLISASSANEFHSSRRLHLWNIRTGRHCADFVGSYTNLIGLGFGASGESLVAASREKLCRWNFQTCSKLIAEFESSLLPPQK